MNNTHVTPMIKRFPFATAILFVVAIIMITIPFNRFILSSTAVVAQQGSCWTKRTEPYVTLRRIHSLTALRYR